MSINNSKYNSLALWMCALGFCSWAWILTIKFYHFGYWGWDLPLYDQLMWNLCRGSVQTSLFGGNFLIDHANYIAFFLAPFYFFFQNPMALLYFKLAAFFIGSYIFYLITLKKIGGLWGILFLLGYLFYPANISMLLFEFNFENLALPLIFLVFYFFEERKIGPFLLTCFFLSIVKENMPFVVGMFGVYGLLTRRNNKKDIFYWGLCPLVLSIDIFLVEMFLVYPWLTKNLGFHASGYFEFYRKSFLADPLSFFQNFFTLKKILFLSELFGPLLLLAILNPQILFLGLPLFFQNLLSNFFGQQSIFFYYASSMAVFVFLAAIQSLSILEPKQRRRLSFLMIIAVLFFSFCYIREWNKRIPWQDKELYIRRRQLLAKIPPQAGVLSSYNFLPFLSQRKDLYLFGRTFVLFTRQNQNVPDSVNYALIDFSTEIIDKFAVKELLLNKHWTVEAAIENVVLLRKNFYRGNPLIEGIQEHSRESFARSVFPDNPLLELKSFDFPAVISSKTTVFPVNYYWKALQDLPQAGKVIMTISQKGKSVWNKTRRILYSLPFKKDEEIKDCFYYVLPHFPKGQYDVEIYIWDSAYQWTGPFIKKLEVR
ncbi:MAG: DUF2079 domain-containing protein [Candidatus Omnitrophica bacterium]|nr:DUF2079 domain-containing protein [Candidatus Omnitrophota bacterium]